MQMWWYKKWVWSWIEEERLAELRDITSPSIAFHIRGGDIFEADKAQVDLPLLSPRHEQVSQQDRAML